MNGKKKEFKKIYKFEFSQAVPLIMPSLKFVGYDKDLPGSILVTNNGHSGKAIEASLLKTEQ